GRFGECRPNPSSYHAHFWQVNEEANARLPIAGPRDTVSLHGREIHLHAVRPGGRELPLHPLLLSLPERAQCPPGARRQLLLPRLPRGLRLPGAILSQSSVVSRQASGKTKILRLGFPAVEQTRGSPPSLRMTAVKE